MTKPGLPDSVPGTVLICADCLGGDLGYGYWQIDSAPADSGPWRCNCCGDKDQERLAPFFTLMLGGAWEEDPIIGLYLRDPLRAHEGLTVFQRFMTDEEA